MHAYNVFWWNHSLTPPLQFFLYSPTTFLSQCCVLCFYFYVFIFASAAVYWHSGGHYSNRPRDAAAAAERKVESRVWVSTGTAEWVHNEEGGETRW